MVSELQSLLDKIQAEGVNKAEEKAAKMATAKEILIHANEKAPSAVSKARHSDNIIISRFAEPLFFSFFIFYNFVQKKANNCYGDMEIKMI